MPSSYNERKGGSALSVAGCNPIFINMTIIECKFFNNLGGADEHAVIFLQNLAHPIAMDGIIVIPMMLQLFRPQTVA